MYQDIIKLEKFYQSELGKAVQGIIALLFHSGYRQKHRAILGKVNLPVFSLKRPKISMN